METERERELKKQMVELSKRFNREFRAAYEPLRRELMEIQARKSIMTVVK